jgi:hypothetical protein
MKKHLVLVLSISALVCAGVVKANTPQQTQTYDEKHLLVDRLFKLTLGEEFEQTFKALTATFSATLSAEKQQELARDMAELMQTVRAVVAERYKQQFSKEELQNLVTFYTSDLGKKSIALSTQITPELSRLAQEKFQQLYAKYMSH